MKLSKEQIKDILVNNPTKKLWDAGRSDAVRLQMHVLGAGLQKYMEKIDLYESPKAHEVRKKYCKTNRDLFARLLRPIDNIWSGRGGGTFYNTTEANDKRLRKMLADIGKNYTVRAWIRNFWRPRYIDDPMGIIFMEVDPVTNPNGAYPTYKASAEIFDALPNGRRLEYVVFKTKEPGIYRVVDDATDQMVKLEGEKVQLLKSKEYPVFINWFDKVPALIVSDIPRDGRDDLFCSPITDEVELADTYLRDGSISSIYRLKQGFPKSWKYPEVCGTCKGKKFTDGATECKDCNGTGIKLLSTPADVAVFAWPTKEEPEISEKGGFIQPSIDYLKYADVNQETLEQLIHLTHWGAVRQKVDPENNPGKDTATGKWIDIQPVNNRLILYAEAAESVEKFITDQIALYNFSGSWIGSSVSLGRRFMIENPDTIWEKYTKARAQGSPLSVLDDILQDYYETKLVGNQLELQRYLKLIKLEPGVHSTLGEAKANLPFAEFIKKVYFQEFVSSLPDMVINNTDLASLRTQLETFTKKKLETDIVDPAAAAANAGGAPGEGGQEGGSGRGGPAGEGKTKPEAVPAGA